MQLENMSNHYFDLNYITMPFRSLRTIGPHDHGNNKFSSLFGKYIWLGYNYFLLPVVDRCVECREISKNFNSFSNIFKNKFQTGV